MTVKCGIRRNRQLFFFVFLSTDSLISISQKEITVSKLLCIQSAFEMCFFSDRFTQCESRLSWPFGVCVCVANHAYEFMKKH